MQGKDMLFSYVMSVIENKDFYAEYHCEKVQYFTRILLEKVIRFCPDYKLSEGDVETICFRQCYMMSEKLLFRIGFYIRQEDLILMNWKL